MMTGIRMKAQKISKNFEEMLFANFVNTLTPILEIF